MEKCKKAIYRLLYPDICWIIFSIFFSGILLWYTFYNQKEDGVIQYISCGFSTYTVIIVLCRGLQVTKKIIQLICQNPLINRCITDVPYRIKVSLCLALLLNLAYAMVKLFAGIFYNTVWFTELSVYYILLCLIRLLLLSYAGKVTLGENKADEYKQYRRCGFLLIGVNMILTGIIIQMVRNNQGYHYPGNLIYVAALFAFYAVIAAVANLIRYRQYDSPVISAAQAICFTTACVSILALQTAMLAQFDNNAAFRKNMNSITGSAVCIMILGIAFYMIANATKQLKKLGNM
ncbi:hypothetical protein AALB53_23070 [Lachnospiraceae bacterium 47-T17]